MENAGFKCVGSCEIDKYARQIYTKNFGSEHEFFKDAREINPNGLKFDVLVAGFPCQSFSTAGKRLGFEDTRGTLFYEIARIAKEVRPRCLFLENVKGLLNHEQGSTFTKILDSLYEMGFTNIEWQVINSKYYVPQNRERVFIIARTGNECESQIFPLEQDGSQHESPRETSSGKGEQLQNVHSGSITSTYYKGWGAGRTMIRTANSNSNTVNRRQVREETWSLTGNPNDFAIEEPPKSIQRCGDRDKNTYSLKDISHCLTSNPMSDYQNKIIEPKLKHKYDLYPEHQSHAGRVYESDGLARSLISSEGGVGKQSGLYEVQDRIRKLTPTECERLQGFPDGWTEGASDTQRYKMIGNAVTTNVISDIAGRLYNALKKETQ
jgi:DNA (cytosine-5)-methyltransferase 1